MANQKILLSIRLRTMWVLSSGLVLSISGTWPFLSKDTCPHLRAWRDRYKISTNNTVFHDLLISLFLNKIEQNKMIQELHRWYINYSIKFYFQSLPVHLDPGSLMTNWLLTMWKFHIMQNASTFDLFFLTDKSFQSQIAWIICCSSLFWYNRILCCYTVFEGKVMDYGQRREIRIEIEIYEGP
jgi:hypothetical protein